MNTKTILIIAGVALAGYVAYRLYTQNKVTQVQAPPAGAGTGSPPAAGTGNGNGTAAIINAGTGALDALGNLFDGNSDTNNSY